MSTTPKPTPSAGAIRAAESILASRFSTKPMDWGKSCKSAASIIDRETGTELAQIKAILADPHAVHINLLRGTIAWTPDALRHVLGDHYWAARLEGAISDLLSLIGPGDAHMEEAVNARAVLAQYRSGGPQAPTQSRWQAGSPTYSTDCED